MEKGGEIVAYPLALGVAKEKIENHVEPEAEDHIFHASGKEGAGLFLSDLSFGVVIEIAADHKEGGHGKAI